jgi:hypothetical protein
MNGALVEIRQRFSRHRTAKPRGEEFCDALKRTLTIRQPTTITTPCDRVQISAHDYIARKICINRRNL